MNILLIGGGGREHALAWRLRRSPSVDQLFAAPGNPGIAEEAAIVPVDPADHGAVAAFCRENNVGLVVVGPEVPLVAGLVDDLTAAGVLAFGPTRAAAQLEGSKGFTKDLCVEAGMPTAAYRRFRNRDEARTYIREVGAPVVVKADGLAAGKGVTVAETLEAALAAVDACFGSALGEGAEVVIEEKLTGPEASLFALCDGERAIIFGTAQDYKRVGDGDTGPNTGGMGAISPAPALTPELAERAMAEIVRPAVAAMAARGTPFRGILYAGLMLTAEGPKLIEFNVRFGDPECQALMPRFEGDLALLLRAATEGDLRKAPMPVLSKDPTVTVVMAARGYPGAYATGTSIDGLGAADAISGVKVFQAGTALRQGQLVANGGRVLGITARGETSEEARQRAYAGVAGVSWSDGFFRMDIGR